jgi:uncharacterized radical SAM protein YgiQ
MSRAEMEALGWQQCDVILITGDAYIDHPSFGMALVGRLLEAQGFRVGIISQPDWHSRDAFRVLGRPRLYFGVTSGNMDSMVNRYTAYRKERAEDAYTPNGEPNKRPDRSLAVYAQCARQAFPGVNVIVGSIEASLRRIAHFDYWSNKVRRSVLLDSQADLLLFGNAERALVEVTHRLAQGESIHAIRDVRGTAFLTPLGWKPGDDWQEANSSRIDTPGKIDPMPDPYAMAPEDKSECATQNGNSLANPSASAAGTASVNPAANPSSSLPANVKPIKILSREERRAQMAEQRDKTVVRLPSFEQVSTDPVMYAHASRVFHLESNPGNARALVQAHGKRDVWLTPPPLPLSTEEMDGVYGLPYARAPHPVYGNARIPAWEMIRFSVNIMRGCFGGCTFCSITEHEGRIIQSRSEGSIIREIEEIRDKVKGFTGVISDLGGPTANMYRLACKEKEIEQSCRRLSCVYPTICSNLNTDHSSLVALYRRARALPGIKKILIGSGLRYDLAVRSPEYVKELVTHHVGGLLKIAPEHTEHNTLSKMMKPGMGSYDEFKRMFDQYSKEAGKTQYLIPYFIAAHPGSSNEDMLNLALWLKKNNFRLDQVQTFVPTPMAMATTMYHTRKNPLHKVTDESEVVETARGAEARRLQKAFLKYHDPANWPILREGLQAMGRTDLIGDGAKHLIPAWQPASHGGAARAPVGSLRTPGYAPQHGVRTGMVGVPAHGVRAQPGGGRGKALPAVAKSVPQSKTQAKAEALGLKFAVPGKMRKK